MIMLTHASKSQEAWEVKPDGSQPRVAPSLNNWYLPKDLASAKNYNNSKLSLFLMMENPSGINVTHSRLFPPLEVIACLPRDFTLL